MKIAVSSYSYNQYISKGEMTQLDALRKAAEQGFDAIEFTELRPENRKDATKEERLEYARLLRGEAEKLGIEIAAYLVGASLYNRSRAADKAEVKKLYDHLDVASALGVKLLRHDVCTKEIFDGKVVSFGKMLPTLAANTRKVTKYAKKLGIRTCTENHGFVAQDSDRVEQLYNAVNHENYGILVDMGNFACADEDSVRAVSRLAPYAIHAHAKDFIFKSATEKKPEGFFDTLGGNHIRGTVIGHGIVPVGACVSLLEKAGYEGWISIEFEGLEENINALALGLEFLRSEVCRAMIF